MTRKELIDLINRKKSFLCVGLDTDVEKLPITLKNSKDAVYEFNKAIIEATLPYAVSYKLNIAFYEAMGSEGWDILKRTCDLIPPGEAFLIADAKRGDIGNTASQYAKAFFEQMPFHSITVNPYMGADAVMPFLLYEGKWSVVLGLTSNLGAADIQMQKLQDGRFVFEAAIESVAKLGSTSQIMFVVGATQTNHFKSIRNIVPDHFLLVPGVGAQGAGLKDVMPLLTKECGLLVNSSRQIIYASSKSDFAEAASDKAKEMQVEMATLLGRK